MKKKRKGWILVALVLLLFIPGQAQAAEEPKALMHQPPISQAKPGDGLNYSLQLSLPEAYQHRYKSLVVSIRFDEKLDMIGESLQGVKLDKGAYQVKHSKLSKSQKALVTLVIPDLSKLKGARDFSLDVKTRLDKDYKLGQAINNSYVVTYTDFKGEEYSFQKDLSVDGTISINPIHAYDKTITGKAMANADIRVFRGQTQVALGKAGSDGSFQIVLNPQPEGVSLRLDFTAKGKTKSQEVLVQADQVVPQDQPKNKKDLEAYVEAASGLARGGLSEENILQIDAAVTRGRYLLVKSGGTEEEIQKGIEDLKEVYSAFRPAFMNGYPDGSFGPKKPMSRAEVAKVFTTVISGGRDQVGFSSFKDVADSKWYAASVGFMEKNGLLSGYGDGTFKPENSINRAEFAALVARYMKLENTGGAQGFSDLASNHWAKTYIDQVSSAGLMNGRGQGKFAPGEKITREEVATVLNKITNRKPNETIISQYGKNPFRDVEETSWSYYQIMEVTGK